MSWWNAKYKNNHGEYEITFGSQQYEKAKAVEKVCRAVIDKVVKSPDDVEIVRQGVWVSRFAKHWKGKDECGECGFHEKDRRDLSHYKYCPNCGAKMDGDTE